MDMPIRLQWISIIENLLKELRKDNSFIDGWSKESYVFGIFKPIGQNSPKRHLDIIAKKSRDKTDNSSRTSSFPRQLFNFKGT